MKLRKPNHIIPEHFYIYVGNSTLVNNDSVLNPGTPVVCIGKDMGGIVYVSKRRSGVPVCAVFERELMVKDSPVEKYVITRDGDATICSVYLDKKKVHESCAHRNPEDADNPKLGALIALMRALYKDGDDVSFPFPVGTQIALAPFNLKDKKVCGHE